MANNKWVLAGLAVLIVLGFFSLIFFTGCEALPPGGEGDIGTTTTVTAGATTSSTAASTTISFSTTTTATTTSTLAAAVWPVLIGDAWEFNDDANGVAVDEDGNVYIAGAANEKLGAAWSGGMDMVVIKLDPMGGELWTKQLGTAAADAALRLAVGSDNSLYIVGYTEGDLAQTNEGGKDLFLIKLDRASGEETWKRQIGTSADDAANGVALDASGNVYIVGYTGGALEGNVNAGETDIFLIKYSSSGGRQWIRQIGTAESDSASDIDIDTSGNIYITGSTQGRLVGDGDSGYQSVFLLKYDSSGSLGFVRQYEGIGNAVAVGPSGDVYIAGSYGEPSSLLFLRLDSSGSLESRVTMDGGDMSFVVAKDIAADNSGKVYITGYTDGSIGAANPGKYNHAFLVKYDSGGSLEWARQYQYNGDLWKEYANGVALDGSGENIFIVASVFDRSIGAISSDMLVIRYGPDGDLK